MRSLSAAAILVLFACLSGTVSGAGPTIAPVITSVRPFLQSINVIWRPVTDPLQLNGNLVQYRIVLKENGTVATNANANASDTGAHIPNLKYGTTYTVEIAAISTGGVGIYSPATTTTTQQILPPAPTLTLASLNRMVTVNLTENRQGYQRYYHFQHFCCYFRRTSVSGIPGSSFPTVKICSATSPVTLAPAEEDATYVGYCSVRNTANADGFPVHLPTPTKTNAAAPSGAPGNVVSLTRTSTSVALTWTAVDPYQLNGVFTGYNITCRLNGVVVYTANQTATSVTILGLVHATTYSVQIAAISTGGIGVFTHPKDVATSQDFPAAPAVSLGDLSKMVTVRLTAVAGNYNFLQFCCYFMRTSVSAIPFSNLARVAICSATSPVTLAPAEEDATYVGYCSVRNTANADGLPVHLPTPTKTNAAAPSGAPGNVVALTRTSTSVALTWTAVDPYQLNGVFTGYNITCRLNGVVVYTANQTATSVTILGLVHATTYSVQVAAISTGGLGVFTHPKDVATSQDSLFAPTATFQESTTSITVVLNVTTGHFTIDRYCCKITRTMVSGERLPSATETICGQTTTIVVQGRDEDAVYSIAVFVNNTASQPSPDSMLYTVKTLSAAPSGPPQSLLVTNKDATFFTLSWGAVSALDRNGPITAYMVRYGTMALVVPGLMINITVTGLMINITGLLPNRNYDVTVEAIGYQSQSGPQSAVEHVRTLEAVPDPPTATATSTGRTMSITITSKSLNWNTSQYCTKIQRRGLPGTYQSIICKSSPLFIFTRLQEYTTYRVEATVKNNLGQEGMPKLLTIVTKEARPSAPPQKLIVSNTTSSSAQLSWIPPNSIDQNGVLRYYVIALNSTSPLTTRIEFNVTASGSTILPELKAFTNYSVSVAAATTVGSGNFSTPISFRTEQAAPSVAPGNLHQLSRMYTTVQLTWTRLDTVHLNGGFVAYNIRLWGAGGKVRSWNVSTNAANISNLFPGMRYDVVVAAISTGGVGIYTDVFVAVTKQDVPSAPSVTLSRTSSTISVALSVAPGQFKISHYCARFTQVSVAGNPRHFPTLTVCNDTYILSLRATASEATYFVTGFVNNTFGQSSRDSQVHVVTTLSKDTAAGGNQQSSTATVSYTAIGIGSAGALLAVILLAFVTLARRRRGRIDPAANPTRAQTSMTTGDKEKTYVHVMPKSGDIMMAISDVTNTAVDNGVTETELSSFDDPAVGNTSGDVIGDVIDH